MVRRRIELDHGIGSVAVRRHLMDGAGRERPGDADHVWQGFQTLYHVVDGGPVRRRADRGGGVEDDVGRVARPGRESRRQDIGGLL